MTSASVVSLELIINLGRGLELLLKAVSAYERGRPIHLIKIPYLLRNLDISIGII